MSEHLKALLRNVDEAAAETFDLGTRRAAARRAGSRRKAYERGLREVRDLAGRDQADELAAWIQSVIRTEERYPSAREVRKHGARLVRESGEEVSRGSWLGA